MMLRIKGRQDRSSAKPADFYFAWGCSSENAPGEKALRELRDGNQQPLDVLRAGQPVVAVLDEGEHDVVLGEP
jgi:hypothetical protein